MVINETYVRFGADDKFQMRFHEYFVQCLMIFFPGIPRTENSELVHPDVSDWGYYKCQGVKYNVMTIESMDIDSETRRVGPVAVRQTVNGKKYLNLFNGPPDYGWCSGYFCGKRLSVFNAVLVTGNANQMLRLVYHVSYINTLYLYVL